MKKLYILLFVFLLLPIVIAEKPEDVKLNGFVNDYAGVLSDEQEVVISAMLKEMYDNKTAQIAVVTIKSLDGMDIEGFAYKVAEGKLGDAERDNGLLLLVAVEDRKYRFEVGRGLEPVLNDAKIGRVGRNEIVPAFKEGDYFTGINNAVNEVIKILNDPKYYEEEVVDAKRVYLIFGVLGLIIAVMVVVFVIEAKKTKTDKKDRLFVAGAIAGSMMRTGFRGGSGGFGGFGGGGFGGGGASGGW